VVATARLWAHDYLHVLIERVRVAIQALEGKPVELAGKPLGNLGLAGAENLADGLDRDARARRRATKPTGGPAA